MTTRLRPTNSADTVRRDPFYGASAMAELMRRTDWTATPLGDPDGWPDALRTAVDVCLESRFPIVLWWGPELTLLYNDAYARILGAKHPASLGMAGEQCWAEIWPTIGPMLHGVVTGGEATWSDDLPLFIDRRGFSEECYFTFSYSPIRVADGTVGGVFCAVTETTGRVRAERRLALFRDLSAIVSDDPAGAAERAVERVADADRDVTTVALVLHDAPDAVTAPVGATAPSAADVERTAREHRRRRPASGPPGIDRAPDAARRRWSDDRDGHSTTVFALRDEASGRHDLLVLGRNPAIPLDQQYEEFFDLVASHVATVPATARAQLAERRRADALAALDRAKTVFFTNVSHEFRTPLTLIDAPLRELADDADLDGATRDRVELAIRAAGRLRRLVNTLLEFSRIESGTSRAEIASVDLGDLATDVVSVFRSAFESAGLYLRVVGEAPARPVAADPDMLERVLLNLMSNAFKFTQHGGVELRLGSDDAQAVLSVADTGIGIAAADIDRVFDRFARVEPAWSRSSEGSGIGLALACELTRLQGGTLTLASEPGVGSTFTLRLPFSTGKASAARVSAHERRAFADEASGWLGDSPGATDGSPSEPAAGRRVLIVDDNADMRRYLGRILGRHWSTESVADGRAALERIGQDRPDLVLADVMMPGLDGLGLVARIRADPAISDLPVILLSARAGEEARADGLAGGADDYLVKPFTATDLVARVTSQLERAEARRTGSEALRKSEARWRTLIEGNPSLILTTDARGSVTYLNPAWLRFLGRDAPGPIGSTWNDVIRPDDLPPFLDAWTETVERGTGLTTEARVVQADGAYRWVSLTSSPIPDAGSAPSGWISVGTDVHEARTSAEAREAFLGVLAHELRTPITSIYAGSVLLERTVERDGSAARSLASDIGTETARLRRLVDDLVVISRVERGASLHRDEPVLIQRVVDRTVREDAARYPRRRLDLRLEPGLPPVSGDDGYVEQIVRNLLSNAMKYGGGRLVTVEAHHGPGTEQVTLAVRDRGPGFVDGDEAQVFDLFYRGPSATRRAAGSGIGLYVVRALAEAMGGAVSARTHPGGGAEVSVTLRIARM